MQSLNSTFRHKANDAYPSAALQDMKRDVQNAHDHSHAYTKDKSPIVNDCIILRVMSLTKRQARRSESQSLTVTL